jgi:hypothetical protein
VHLLFQCGLNSIHDIEVQDRVIDARNAIHDIFERFGIPIRSVDEQKRAVMTVTGSFDERTFVDRLEQPRRSERCWISALSTSPILRIFSFLSNVDLAHARSVCKLWSTLGSHQYLWAGRTFGEVTVVNRDLPSETIKQPTETFDKTEWEFIWDRLGDAFAVIHRILMKRRKLVPKEVHTEYMESLNLPIPEPPRTIAPEGVMRDMMQQMYNCKSIVEFDAFIAGPMADTLTRYHADSKNNYMAWWVFVKWDLEKEPKYGMSPKAYHTTLGRMDSFMLIITEEPSRDRNNRLKEFYGVKKRWNGVTSGGGLQRTINMAKTMGLISLRFLNPWPAVNWDIVYNPDDFANLPLLDIPIPPLEVISRVKTTTIEGLLAKIEKKFPGSGFELDPKNETGVICSYCKAKFSGHIGSIYTHCKSLKHINLKTNEKKKK